MLISSDELEVVVSKIKDKWDREFDILIYFFEDNIRAWIVDYFNPNNNIFVIICEAWEEFIEI